MQNNSDWGKLKTMNIVFRNGLRHGRAPLRLSGWVACGLLLSAALVGCELGSGDSTTANVTGGDGMVYNFSGLYAPSEGQAHLVVPANGAALKWIRLLHYGRVLEGYDSARQTWSGQISGMDGSKASFTLRGRTSAGVQAEIVGVLRYAKGDGESRAAMEATWVEPNFAGDIFATASVSPPYTGGGGDGGGGGGGGGEGGGGGGGGGGDQPGGLEIAPEIRWFVPSGGISGYYTVYGGTPPYTWRVSDSALGTLSPTTGTRVTYTTTRIPGTNIITVTDGNHDTATAWAEYH